VSGFSPTDPGDALSYITHPVAIITANDGILKNGMTAIWLTRVSGDPPVLCVCISPKRHTWKMLEGREYFGVSILARGQEDIGMTFGTKSGRDTDKFSMLGMEPFMAAHDIPLVPGSLAGLVCRKTHQIMQGDHWVLFGEVVEAWEGGGDAALNWQRSGYLGEP